MTKQSLKVEGPQPVGKFAKFTDGIWREVPDWSEGVPLYTTPQQRKPLTDEQTNKAAMTLAECMDYPWAHMPEEGKRNMRKHAKAIIEAAHGIKE
jgi:hypothetical protein